MSEEVKGTTILTAPAETSPPADPKPPVAEAPPTAPATGEAPKEGEAAKPKEEAPKAPEPPPEKYELKLPQDSLLDASDLERIAAYAKAQGLSQKDAEAMVERDSRLVADYQKRQVETLKKTSNEAWINEIRNDKEFGGEAFKQTAETCKATIAAYADQDFKDALESTGLGNHPALVRFVARVGKKLGVGNDKLVSGGAGVLPQHQNAAHRIWGSDGTGKKDE